MKLESPEGMREFLRNFPVTRRKPLQKVDAEYARASLDYNPDTGDFVWKERPLEHFATLNLRNLWNAEKVGKPAGFRDSYGYFRISLSTKAYKAHRLAWLISTGEWPNHGIDHINGNRGDNRIANLREATPEENARNCNLSSRNKSGIKGVSWNEVYQLWVVKLGSRYIGSFKLKSDAEVAIREARIRLHGKFANHGEGYDPCFE